MTLRRLAARFVRRRTTTDPSLSTFPSTQPFAISTHYRAEITTTRHLAHVRVKRLAHPGTRPMSDLRNRRRDDRLRRTKQRAAARPAEILLRRSVHMKI